MKEQNGHTYSFEQLQAFADGTVDDALRPGIERHLADCAECRRTVNGLRALDERIGRAESAEAPAGYFDTFNSRVASRIAAARRPAPLPRRLRLAWWGLVPAAAAALLVLVVTLDREPLPVARPLVRIPAPEIATTGDWPAQDETAVGDDRRQAAAGREALPVPSAAAVPAPAAAAPQPAVLALSEDKDKEEAAGGVRALKRAAAKAAPAAAECDRIDAAPAGQSAPAAEEKTAPAPAVSPVPGTAVAVVPTGPAMLVTAQETPAPMLEQLPTPRGVDQVQVIVINLPDGRPDCPAPAVATAIGISLSPAGPPAVRAGER